MKLLKLLLLAALVSSGIVFSSTVLADASLPVLQAPDIKVSIPGMTNLQDVHCTETGCSIPWLAQYIGGLQKYAIGIVAILAVVTMMIGGIVWLTAGGNQQRITEAKKWINGSLMGLVLTFAAYLILYTINPDLTALKNVNIAYIQKIDLESIVALIKDGEPITKEEADIMGKFDNHGVISHTVGKSAKTYKGQSCDKSMFANGQAVEFFTTGYYKPPYENTPAFFCDMGLQCSCPTGSHQVGPNKTLCKHSYKYCSPFPASTPYCTKNSAGHEPKVGEIAADTGCFSLGDQICLGGKLTLTVADTGSAIKGRRFDIYSGGSRQTALGNTGVASITLGPCH